MALFRSTFASLPGGWHLFVVHNNGVTGGFGAGTVAPDVVAVLGAVEIVVLLILNRHESSLGAGSGTWPHPRRYAGK